MTIDLKRRRPDLYRPSAREFVEVDVPETAYLAVDGHGDPNTSQEYAQAVAALFAAGYAVRATIKADGDEPFVVGPLEGLWSSADPGSFGARRKGEWDWTMLVPLPDAVSPDQVERGLAAAARRRPDLAIDRVRLLVLHEGRSLQILHVGSFDDEAPVLARLHGEVMPRRRLTWNGPHHEIYLSDPRRVPPERLRTVLRQPVAPLP